MHLTTFSQIILKKDSVKCFPVTIPGDDSYYWRLNAGTSVGSIQYNQNHRPSGIGDNTGANKPQSLKTQQIPKISVTWNKETDSTEIHMEEEGEEPEPPAEPNIS